MTCKWCGSDRHESDVCPTLNLTKYLLGQEYDKDHMPDLVTVIDLEDLLEKTEEEFHDEVVNIRKLNRREDDAGATD